ncbi:MAG: DUF1800 domain-containing protein [SAR202 cluster bacterium]|nr:DUF1800 domain-containing protein [SAR202 cluster bacterium]
MADAGLALYAHLMRRAGFGYRIGDLEKMAEKGYEQCVEDLLHPERFPDIEVDLLERYYGTGNLGWSYQWWHRMINSPRHLHEKMTLFWHHLFATGDSKASHTPSAHGQIDTFRRVALSDFRTLLTELSKDPAMIFWLDNNENLKEEPNENYGRELLELFSMGVGNYTEQDVKAAAQAFTGWTLATPIPGAGSRYGGYPSRFVYRDEEHNYGVKTFLGETGRFNGEDIIDIVCRQPATSRFLARHLYSFFVEDEPPVSAWNEIPPKNVRAIEQLAEVFAETNGDIKAVLRTIFNSEWFKQAEFKRVKSPVELVTGVLKLVGTYRGPDPDFADYFGQAGHMGQSLLNPLTVEGWPNGTGWIDGGTLNMRVNFAVNEVSDASKPGIQQMIARLEAESPVQPDDFVSRCIEYVGPAPIRGETRLGLLNAAMRDGPLDFKDESKRKFNEALVSRMVQLVVSTREYQLC